MKYEHIFEKIYRETHIVERRRKTTEVFIEEAKQIHPEYDYSKVNYINNYTKVIVGCPKHGDFLTTPNNLLFGHGCPKCGKESMVKKLSSNTEEFIEEAKQIHPEYDYSKVNYVGNKTKVIVGCPKHGDFLITPSHLLMGRGCPKCGFESRAKKLLSNTEEFIKKAKQIHPEYDYSKVNYVYNKTKVIVGCPKHGDFLTTPNNLMQGYGCPICSESKGEIEVREWLENHNITYKRQHRFADLKKYPYDFYLPDFNLLIEYNGIQHYEEVPYFHRSPSSFDGQLTRDRIKKEYAEKNGIKLLVIPYWEFKNIDKILSVKLLYH